MKMLVALDGSPFAEAILPKAAAIAESTGTEVILMRVLNPADVYTTWRSDAALASFVVNEVFPAAFTHDRVMAESKDQAADRAIHDGREYLEEKAHRFFPGGARTDVTIGEHVAQELLEYVRRNDVDFIAMATHGRSGIAKLVMGSVASEVLQSKAVPVLLIRPDALVAAVA